MCGHCFCIPNNGDDFILLIKPSDAAETHWTEVKHLNSFFMLASSNVADYFVLFRLFKIQKECSQKEVLRQISQYQRNVCVF